MLTADDIKKLTDYQVELLKDVFPTKKDVDTAFDGLNKKISNLQTSVDAIAKGNDTNNKERVVADRRIKDLENWVDKAAPKVGVKFHH